ncbi:MAG: SpoIID/LytB domain-containing protein [Anaerolineales bacterium]|nr:SpoIID/LytB domain-containing protein [Anaerolineales bacterium]MCB9126925.1 SpoIID/LytB domain-containing protein [Ardenticatenales bacterium]MCB9171469.1 SpoIID/LytB domain-containing protein [Ardenticatenales bacterium]
MRIPMLLVTLAAWLCLALTLPRSAPSNESPRGATRITEGAALLSLEAWPSDGVVLARTQSGWQRITLASGALTPTEAVPRPPSPLTIVQGGDGHALELNGQTLWRSDREIIAQATLSDDGQWLVAALTPRGSEMAPFSELWRYEVDSAEWRALTENETAEGFPLISPDGSQVAFLREGDLWLIPSDRTTIERDDSPQIATVLQAQSRAPTDHQPPETIRVKHVSEGVSNPNTCRPDTPHGQIDTIPFEDYVKRVVPYEVPSSWPTETLRAQAVAARSYGWYYVLNPAGADYDVTDTTSHQYMCDQTFAATNSAVDDTEGQHLTHEGEILKAFFSAENSSPTRAYPNWEPISAVDDPPSFGKTRNGHGWGMGQWGAKRHADAGWSYRQILRKYYTNAPVEPPAGNNQSLLDIANRPERRFLRGDGSFTTLNANHVDLTQLRWWYNDPSSGWQYSDWQDRAFDPELGWWHLFDISGLPDTPYDNYRLEGSSVPENLALDPRPVLRLGIDRTPPTLDVALSQSFGSATFTLTSEDGLSGVERGGISLAAWQQEAETIAGGTVVNDPTASGGAALSFTPSGQGEETVSFAPIPLDADLYRLWFRLRTSGPLGPDEVVTLRVIDDLSTPQQRGIYPLRRTDFSGEGWQWFYVDADSRAAYNGTAANALTPQLTWHGQRSLWVDRVALATRPPTFPTATTLSVGAPTTVLLYANDHAGNVALVGCDVEPLEAAATLYLPLVTRGGTSSITGVALAAPARSFASTCTPVE